MLNFIYKIDNAPFSTLSIQNRQNWQCCRFCMNTFVCKIANGTKWEMTKSLMAQNGKCACKMHIGALNFAIVQPRPLAHRPFPPGRLLPPPRPAYVVIAIPLAVFAFDVARVASTGAKHVVSETLASSTFTTFATTPTFFHSLASRN